LTENSERALNKIASKFDTAEELVVSSAYGDGGTTLLFPRLIRAAMNQWDGSDETVSRYAIWANTVRDHISAALRFIEKGETKNGRRLLIAAHNSLSAFSEIQKRLNPSEEVIEVQLDKLFNMGFKRVGLWKWSGDKIVYNLEFCADLKNVLYAFTCDNSVLYIGKTNQPLKKRMYGYQNPGPTQSTNIKGHGFIRGLVTSGKEVEILALPDNGLLYYGGFHVNLAAGLEDSTVSKIKPAWNRMGI
jgi:hypothetical protein